MNLGLVLCCVGAMVLCACAGQPAAKLPDVNALPSQASLPDPLVALDGTKVTRKSQWEKQRRPELQNLFQHYMYGFAPPAPKKLTATVERVDEKFMGGKATLKEITIRYAPAESQPLHLLLITPNGVKGKAPVFLGVNFRGNHTVVTDPKVRITDLWVYDTEPGGEKNRATEATRGRQAEAWQVEQIISRGYALATFYSGDLDADTPDFSDGVHRFYYKEGQTQPGPQEWGTIAAWAWGLSRAMDYLETDKAIDKKRVAVVGHSRLGKTSLLAAAMDERFAMSVPIQAGCGGTAPSRGKVGESVKQINDHFPHWFNDTFPLFNDQTDKLPFDQHCLVALVAPRPVLFLNADEDEWANPEGQFEMLVSADPVYRLLGVEGVASKEMPETGKLMDSRLGYFIRPGKHEVNATDWKAILDFADLHLRAGT